MGTLVPIGAIANCSRTAGLLTVNLAWPVLRRHLSFNLPKGVSLGDAVGSGSTRSRPRLGVPASIPTLSFSGTAKISPAVARQRANLAHPGGDHHNLHRAGILYESFVHPLTILHPACRRRRLALATLSLFGFDLTLLPYQRVFLY